MDDLSNHGYNKTLNGKHHTREEMLHHPLFLAIERQIATHLIDIHRRTPRLARFAASHRKWLLTQTLFAMHIGRNRSDPRSGLTAGRLMEAATTLKFASKNTAASFLSELVAYKFLRDVPDGTTDRRLRRLETTQASEDAMYAWFIGHMQCLDHLDGGNRAAAVYGDIRLFELAQPRAAGILILEPIWRVPRDSIGNFLWSEVGGLVLHDLISRLPDDARERDRIILEDVSVAESASEFGISLTNVKRMFRKAELDNLLGWEKTGGRNVLWLSRGFIEDYFHWQSAKFFELDRAVHWAADRLRLAQPTRA
jgi:AraC-like DNA-binding protein